MQTQFTPAQLADPDIARSNDILRACVHCGFCTATCPTYVLTGDELDSPRGRIYLIKEFLERDAGPDPALVTHIDRCLSCLSCMTTCPSGVDYMHLVDTARSRMEPRARRPVTARLFRRFLALTLPYPCRFAVLMRLARAVRPLASVLPRRIAGPLRLLPAVRGGGSLAAGSGTFPAQGRRRHRVALMPGCVQRVVRPEINAATIRLLTRHGCEVVIAEGSGCCGALDYHLGRDDTARAFCEANLDAWARERRAGGLDAIIATASGCGTQIKDTAHVLRGDSGRRRDAAEISSLTRDICEFVSEIGLPEPAIETGLRVAYQSPCSLQHGQKVTDLPVDLLARAGFDVRTPREPHLCCGSAGTYNLLQPDFAQRLGQRKAENLAQTGCTVIATGNIGCQMQLAPLSGVPIVHTVQLLDWATGGPKPDEIES